VRARARQISTRNDTRCASVRQRGDVVVGRTLNRDAQRVNAVVRRAARRRYAFYRIVMPALGVDVFVSKPLTNAMPRFNNGWGSIYYGLYSANIDTLKQFVYCVGFWLLNHIPNQFTKI
jgi:hypothetical protein